VAPSQHAASSTARRAAREEKERQEREARQQRGGLNNPTTLLSAAYADSKVRAPVFFLVTHAVNVLEIVSDFHQKRLARFGGVKLQHFSLGQGLEELVGARLEQAAQNGDWIILENLHLVPDWLPVFEETMATWTGPDVNPRFRVWASAVPAATFPASLLEKCVKVALQPPKTIKQKMEKMLLDQEKEGFFRKAGKHANYHKNVFLGLAYLHANLGGRARYGTLGWHLPYQFDVSDFEISNAQLREVMKHSS
jgi:dynein heavy chain